MLIHLYSNFKQIKNDVHYFKNKLLFNINNEYNNKYDKDKNIEKHANL